jgi:tetratricopeptide (TPR) repeat protein
MLVETGTATQGIMMQGRGGNASRRCPKCRAPLALDNTATLCGRCRRETRDDVLSPPRHLNDGFFETEDFRAAFASQDIGKVIKVYRNHPAHIKLYGRAISQETMGRWLEVNQAQVSRLESPDPPDLGIETLRKYASKLDLPHHLLWFTFPGESLQTKSDHAHIDASNRIRQGLSDVLATIQASELNVDDWDYLVDRIGRDTRHRSPTVLASELLSNLEDIRRFYSRATSGHALRRLSRIAAQMSGLTSQTLLKIDDHAGSLDWARTARLFAAETKDSELRAWVQAQEAYYYFYADDLQTAIESAQYAQQVSSNNHGVGSALAAALEARAYAAQGKRHETLQAIGRAETYTESLDSNQTITSAFGYNEAQLRFHQSNALTQLGEAKAAFAIQDRAIELCAPDDFMDRTLVHLDRADCLVVNGSVADGLQVAKGTLEDLKASQARGLIVNRALKTLELVPSSEAESIEAQELREIVNLIQQAH